MPVKGRRKKPRRVYLRDGDTLVLRSGGRQLSVKNIHLAQIEIDYSSLYRLGFPTPDIFPTSIDIHLRGER